MPINEMINAAWVGSKLEKDIVEDQNSIATFSIYFFSFGIVRDGC